MITRETYAPGPARGAHVNKDGDNWTLIVVRNLRHPPERVWQALTEPEHLREWAPFDVTGSLGVTGATVQLTVVAAQANTSPATVKRAEFPRLLEYNWGDKDLRWELEETLDGTRLTLWHNIDRRFVAWGAAGWHICLDVLDLELDGAPIGRMVGGDAIKFGGWQQLVVEYAAQFGAEAPRWAPAPDQKP